MTTSRYYAGPEDHPDRLRVDIASMANPRTGQPLRIPTVLTIPPHAQVLPWWCEQDAVRACLGLSA